MKKSGIATALVLAMSAALCALWAPAAQAATITQVTGFGSNPGNLLMYEYKPDGLAANRPVVVALHGCTQNASGYGSGTGWTSLADKDKFTVVLPQQQSANNLESCFTWFDSADTTRGQGEAASVAQMVARGIADAGGDPSRVYVTGLSAGGAMTAVMLAAYPDLFAGGGIVAGLPYDCATTMTQAFSCQYPGVNKTPAQWGDLVRAASSFGGPWPTVSVFQGSADYTVAPMNMVENAEQWTNVHGAPSTPTSTDTVAGFPHAVYADSTGAPVVQTYSITGMGHGQPVDPSGGCGTAGAFILDVHLCAAGTLAQTWNLAG